MPDEACRIEVAGRMSSCLSYALSTGLLLVGDTLTFLNNNAAACGVILGLMTFLVNWYYKRKAFIYHIEREIE